MAEPVETSIHKESAGRLPAPPRGDNGAPGDEAGTASVRAEQDRVRRPPPANPEEIQRIAVDEEDRLAFRVGVNLLTLALIGLGIWLLIGYLRG